MNQLYSANRKAIVERILANALRPCDSQPPPPYEEVMSEEADMDAEDAAAGGSGCETDQYIEPHNIQIDASTSISGSGNVVHADIIAATGARAAAAICALLREQQQQFATAQGVVFGTPGISTSQGAIPRARPVRVGLNLSVRISGIRNIVGCPSGVNFMQSPLSGVAPSAVPQSGEAGPQHQQQSQHKVAVEVNKAAEVVQEASQLAAAQLAERSVAGGQAAADEPGRSTNDSGNGSRKRKAPTESHIDADEASKKAKGAEATEGGAEAAEAEFR